MFLYIIENMNPNYNVISCLLKEIPKQHLKYVLYPNKISSFLP